MTEQAFLAQLKKALKGLPEEETPEIVADYEEHFAARKEAAHPEALQGVTWRRFGARSLQCSRCPV